MSNVPPFGDKQRQVGPSSGGGSGPSPAISAPPEVKSSSELGVNLRYALEDHTHQSPVVYWPQGVGPTRTVVSNRSGYITVTSSVFCGTNLCSYESDSSSPGLIGNFSVIGGGYENSDNGNRDVVAGGAYNVIEYDESDCESVISGGTLNGIFYFSQSSIAGGYSNIISNEDPGYRGYGSFIGSGYLNYVSSSGGVAHGVQSRSYIPGQMSFASGSINGLSGASQYSKVCLSGIAEVGGFVELAPIIEPGNVITPANSSSAIVTLDVVAVQDGGSGVHAWTIKFVYMKDSVGTLSVAGQSVVFEYSTAPEAVFTVDISASGSDLSIVMNRNGGGDGSSDYYCQATLKITEIYNGS